MVSRTWQSRVPDVLDALVTLLTAAFANASPTVLVKDGPWISAESADQILSVGWSGFGPGYEFPSRSMSEELGGADVTAEGTQEGLAPSVRERMSITMASICRDGGSRVPSARVTAYRNASIVGATIAPPNHTISGTVLSSTMGATNGLHQVLDRRGAIALVSFTIEAVTFPQQ
jgi:hypothetical protein